MNRLPKWILWCLAFPAVQFCCWLPYYAVSSDCTNPIMASCFPKLSAAMMATAAWVLYGQAYVSARTRPRSNPLVGDEEAAIAEYKIASDLRWSDASYYWRVLTLASLLPVAYHLLAFLLSVSPARFERSALLVLLAPGLIVGAAELMRFLRAATRTPANFDR